MTGAAAPTTEAASTEAATTLAPAAQATDIDTRAGGDWPRTKRALPWLIAVLLVMIYWVPFESISLPISLPINSDLDRFVVGGVVLVWLLVLLSAPQFIRFRAAPINVGIYLFVGVALVSLAANVRQLAWDGELTLSIKQLSLIMSYLAVFLVVSTSLRPSEVTAFAYLLVALAIGTAIGTIYQAISGNNPFYAISRVLFVGTNVTSPAAAAASVGGPGTRPSITGPALHGLADATLISTAVPFCICFARSAATRWPRAGWWLGIVILLAGCFATGRKTALLVPACSFIVLVCYEPRAYVRFLVAPVVAVGALAVVSPHTLSTLGFQVAHASQSSSTSSRTSDYAPIVPDVVSHLLFGRGYGSFDPFKYRILDDQILGWLVETGVFGVIAYSVMVLGAVTTVHRRARFAVTNSDRLMQAVAAASIGYFITNFLYDTFGFREAPYTFFFVAALGVVFVAGTTDRRPSNDMATLDLTPASG